MIIKIQYESEYAALAYYDWITETGVPCMWDFGKKHMIIDFVNEVDATAFRLTFGV